MDSNEIFSNNLKFYVIRSGKTQTQIAHDLGVSKGTFSDWTSGRSHPRMNRVQQIAEYFGIGTSDLVEDGRGMSKKTASIINRLDTDQRLNEMLWKIVDFSNDDLELLIKIVNRMDGKR